VKRIVLAILTLTALAGAGAAQQGATVSVVEPRGFGYFVGDTFTREVNVVVPERYRLDRASQPAPGRINYWLDLRAVAVTETAVSSGRRYRILLDYQTFYVPLSPARLFAPSAILRFSSGDETLSAEVPPFAFVMAPLREVQPEKPEDGPAGYLLPDAVPRKASTLNNRIGLGAGALTALLALTLLAHHQAWWPFRARTDRPFTRAARAIGNRSAHAEDQAVYRESLLDLHRAFDAAAGQRLLAEDVPDFLDAHREFLPYREEITKFFASSRRAFFSDDIKGAAFAMPFAALAALGSRLGETERKAS
jgi:mxaA protein